MGKKTNNFHTLQGLLGGEPPDRAGAKGEGGSGAEPVSVKRDHLLQVLKGCGCVHFMSMQQATRP